MATVALLRAERQFRLSLLSSRLDIAKDRSLLHRSLDAQAAEARDPVFLEFFYQGKVLLLYALGCRFSVPPSFAAARPASDVATASARENRQISAKDIPPAPETSPPTVVVSRANTSVSPAPSQKKDTASDEASATDDTSTAGAVEDSARTAAFGLGPRSKLLESALKACVVDDVNLATAFDALRLEELLEGCYQAPPIELCSAIVLAILGELHTLRQILLNNVGQDARTTVEFIERTLEQFITLLIETGRDRYTYIKEGLVCSILTPPRPSFVQKPADGLPVKEVLQIKDTFALAGLLDEDFDWPAISSSRGQSIVFGLYNRGDSQLEKLLASGSVLSLLRRLHVLQDKCGFYAVDLIRYAVRRQAPLLNQRRQLSFTRVMHALACPLGRSDATVRARAAVRDTSFIDECRVTLQILAEALLDCGIVTWCYESEKERSSICNRGLPPECGERLSQVLCLKVSRSFTPRHKSCHLLLVPLICSVDDSILDSPADWELPQSDILSKQFLDLNRDRARPPPYTQLFFSDFGQCPEVGVGLTGVSEVRSSAYSIFASRFQSATPDFFTASTLYDAKFFTHPVVTAFKDTRRFKQTLVDFFVVKDLEEEPAIWSIHG